MSDDLDKEIAEGAFKRMATAEALGASMSASTAIRAEMSSRGIGLKEIADNLLNANPLAKYLSETAAKAKE